MDNIYNMLEKIRETPGLYLKKKSLYALSHFWNGFAWGRDVEAWEMSTNLNFFENYEEAISFTINRHNKNKHSQIDLIGFNEYVHEYYNQPISTKDATTLIIEHSESDEVAFDKFFDLLDEFINEDNKCESVLSEK